MLTNSKAVTGFAVDDLQKARKFCGETLGLPTSEDDNGSHRGDGPYSAWFTDPAGNVLSVLQDK
jgi:catechol 2,3-dioxygenase-like lactoylglutathione lyase family enzyme